jgi:hypothetical protein
MHAHRVAEPLFLANFFYSSADGGVFCGLNIFIGSKCVNCCEAEHRGMQDFHSLFGQAYRHGTPIGTELAFISAGSGMWKTIQNFTLQISLGSAAFVACGSPQSDVMTDRNTVVTATGTTSSFRAFDPLTYQLNPLTPEDPNTLVSGTNPLELFQYDGIVTADLDSSKTNATSFVTGIGVDVVDTSNNPLPVTIGIEARQYDSATGNFSSQSQIFADHPGADFQKAQNFVVLNKNSPNYLLTGLGIKMRHSRLVNLAVQKKTFAMINKPGRAISAGTFVALPPGWAAVGFILRVSPRSGSTVIPFAQDVVIYVGQLISQ